MRLTEAMLRQVDEERVRLQGETLDMGVAYTRSDVLRVALVRYFSSGSKKK